MAGRAISDKLWQTDIITKNKIFGYLVRNDQMIPKQNHSNNNHFYKKEIIKEKGANSNMYGLIRG